MLFNSFEFILVFLPITVVGFFLISLQGSRSLAIAYLSAASMFFYAWWNPWYLLLILAEVVFNFLLGRQLARSDLSPRARLLLTIFGVGTMLVVLVYFKYTYFILGILLDLVGGVSLLLWGLHMVRSGIVRAYGSDLRRFLGAALRNRFMAFAAGIVVTALLQSSTATGLMTASFVTGGTVDLVPALAIMLGANVGTTLIVGVTTPGVQSYRRVDRPQGRPRPMLRGSVQQTPRSGGEY